MTNAEIFRRAADYIREHGWHQGDAGHHGGPRCAFGALTSVVVGADFWGGNPRVLETEYIAAVRVSGHQSATELFQWNDAPERTKEEVLALLDSLADDEELKDQIASLPPAVKEALPVG